MTHFETPGPVWCNSSQAALADGLRWVVMHQASYPSGQFARTARFLDIVATPVHQGDGVRIYKLEP